MISKNRKAILHCLQQHRGNDDGLVLSLEGLATAHGHSVYQDLFQVLTNLDFSLATAKKYWDEIRRHGHDLSRHLGRRVDLRTAICDYFTTFAIELTNPKLIEIQTYEQTARLARHDELTGLFNRHVFMDSLRAELARSERYGCDLSVLLLDLDDFKQINDTYGHQAGDTVLKGVATIVLDSIRGQDMACRYGGEELVLLLPETGKKNALIIGERIRKEIEKTRFRHNGAVIWLTVSGGLASFPYDAAGAATLLKDADSALYKSKAAGKNFISLFSSNKRRHVRVPYQDDIMIGEMCLDGTVMEEACCKDISGNGLLLKSPRCYATGTKMQARICLSPGQPVLVAGRVARSVKGGPRHYHTALTLTDIDRNLARQIFAYVLCQVEGGKGKAEVRRQKGEE